MRVSISESLRQKLANLPGASREPIRVKGYSDHLLKHALPSVRVQEH
jgi:hypothetical protein